MNLFRPAAAVLLACAVSACVTTLPPSPAWAQLTEPSRAAAATKVAHDDYKKATNFVGANASQYSSLFLRGWRDDRTREATYQLYATSFYSDHWRFYNEAYDSDGNRLEFVMIDQRVDSCHGPSGCYYEETVGLNLSHQYLEAHKDTGIRFKVSGKAGEFVGFLPPAYVKGFLISVDAA